jgi:hypothetical protein
MHQHWLYDQGIGYEVQYLAYFTLLFGMASITKDTFFSLSCIASIFFNKTWISFRGFSNYFDDVFIY